MPSSVIQWMRYDPAAGTLLIAFRGRSLAYRYFDVPLREWTAFREAASKGTYLNRVFKDGGYGFEQVAADVPSAVPIGGSENIWGEPAAAASGQVR